MEGLQAAIQRARWVKFKEQSPPIQQTKPDPIRQPNRPKLCQNNKSEPPKEVKLAISEQEWLGNKWPLKYPSIHEVIEYISEKENISIKKLIGPLRNGDLILKRQIAHYVAIKVCFKSLPQLGRVFNRDHTTLMHSRNKIERMIGQDENLALKLAKYVDELEELAKTTV